MTNLKFSRSLASVIATIALVSSALTGLIYSAPVSAQGTSVNPSAFVPATSSTSPYKLFQGQKFNFQFQVGNTSGSTNPVNIRIGNSNSTLPFATGEGIGPASGCLAYVYIGTSTSAQTFSCTTLFSATGISVGSVPATTANSANIVTVRLGTSSSSTDNGAIVNGASYTGVIAPYAPLPGSTTDLNIGIISNAVALGLEDIGSVVYDITPDVRLSIKKQRITSASDYNSFSGDVATTYTNFQAANPTYSYIFGINIENAGSSAVTNANFQDYLDGTAAAYFSDCRVDASGSTVKPGLGGGVYGTPVNTALTTSETFVIPTIAGGSQSDVSRQTYIAGCVRNTTALPTNGTAGTNIAQITSISAPTAPDVNISFPIRGSAAISGGADLKVTKEVVAGAVNGSAVSSGTTVQYKITVTNTSTTTNCSTPTNLVDYVETFGGVTATTISTNASTVISSNRCNGATGEFAVNLSDVQAAYPTNTDISSTMRVVPVREITPGQSVVILYSVVYNYSSTCPAVGPAPRIRNSAALVDSSTPNAVTGSAIVPNATTNGFNYGPAATVTWDTTGSMPSVTIGTGITLYGDSNSSDNAAYVDISPDVCRPDMRLVSKYRSTPITNGSSTDVLLGEEAEYTIEYQNYAALYAPAGLPKSQAKNVVVSDTLPDGFSFVKLVAPTTATASVSGQTVTVTGLPNISLGDDGVKQVKIVVKASADKAKVGLTNIYNVARVSSNNEDGVYDASDKGSTVDGATGNTVTASVSSTPANNSNIGNNSGRTQVTLRGGPDVQVMKTVDIGEGQLKTDTTVLTYTVKVKNVGTEVANAVMVRDTLPTCTSFGSKVSGPDGTLTSDQRNIDYNLGDLSIDQEVVMVFKANVAQNDACKINNSTVIQNSATATISSLQTDINVTNNTGIANSSVVALNQNAALTKTVDQLVAQPGATLTYTITLKGQGAQFKGNLVDELPANVTFVNADPAAVKDGNKLTWSNVTVDSGKALVATVKVTVNSDANGTSVNKVTATTTDGKVNFAQAVTSIEVAGNAKVTGYIYFDANRNKKEDKLERGADYAEYLKNIRVVAVASNGKEYSAVTNETGAFVIDKLPAGKYTVKVDINTVKGSYKNVQLNVAAIDPSADGLTRVADVRANESFDLVAGFRLFTGQTSTGASSANGVANISGLIALLSFSFLATLAYSELRKKALSL